MHVQDDSEIIEICDRVRSATEPDPEDYKTFLNNCDHPEPKVRQLCITAIFNFAQSFRDQRANSVNKLLNCFEDDDPEIRKSVISRIHILCKQGEFVDAIADVEAQLLCFTKNSEEQKLISESLTKLIHLNKEDAFKSITKAISNETELENRLFLLNWIEGNSKKFGDLITKNRDDLKTIYFEILEKSVLKEDIMKNVLFALNSGHFHTAVEKEGLLNQVELILPDNIEDMTLEQQEDLRQDVDYAVVCEEHIGYLSQRGNGVVQFLFDKGIRLNELDENIRLKIFQAVADLLITRKINKDFKVENYRNLFDLFLLDIPLTDEVDTNSALGLETAANYKNMEALLLILHTLLPYCVEKDWYLRDKEIWTNRCSKFLLLLKKYSHMVKMQLEKLRTKHDEAEYLTVTRKLIVANNIGVILMDFQLPVPKITYAVYRSWKPRLRSPSKIMTTKPSLKATVPSPTRGEENNSEPKRRKRMRSNKQAPVNFRKRLRR